MEYRSESAVEKVEELFHKLCAMRGFLSDVEGSLSNATEETNFTQELGGYFIYEDDVLQDILEEVKQVLRTVCSGEISPDEALEDIASYKEDVIAAIEMIDMQDSCDDEDDEECGICCGCCDDEEEDDEDDEEDPAMDGDEFFLTIHIEGSDSILGLFEHFVEHFTE